MKAAKLLRLYDAGQRDFRGENLRGQNFNGKNLSGADFSGANICSANFAHANLSSAIFIKANAGSQRRWSILLLVTALVLLSLSGIFSGAIFGNVIVDYLLQPGDIGETISGYLIIGVIAIFTVISLWRGTLIAFGFAAGSVAAPHNTVVSFGKKVNEGSIVLITVNVCIHSAIFPF